MTDKQLKEFVSGKTLDELMDLLIRYGRMYEVYENRNDGFALALTDNAVKFVKAEIADRVAGLN